MKLLTLVKTLVDESNPLGDLANDILRDSNFPKDGTDQEMIDYLKTQARSNSHIKDALNELLKKYN